MEKTMKINGNTFFIRFHQFRFLPGRLSWIFSIFLGGDVASVFGRFFFSVILWLKLFFSCFARIMSLEKLFDRDFPSIFLARNVSSEVFGRHLSWDFFGQNCLERFSGVRFFLQMFFVEIRLQNIFGGHVSQILLGRSFFCNLLEEFSIQRLFGREFPFADRLVENFSSDVFR